VKLERIAKSVRRRFPRIVRGVRRGVTLLPGGRWLVDRARRLVLRGAGQADKAPGTAAANAQPDSPPAIVYLRTARWHGTVLELTGWAYRPGKPDERQLRVVADGPDGRRVEFQTRPSPTEVVNTWSSDPDIDHTDAAFTARLDTTRLLTEPSPEVFKQSWLVGVILDQTAERLRFTRRFGHGSAGHLSAEDIGGCLVRPMWSEATGLTLVVARRAVTAVATDLAGSVATVDVVALGDFRPHRAVLESEGEVGREAELLPTGLGAYRIRVDIDQLRGAAESVSSAETSSPDRRWYLAVLAEDGRSRRVHWSGNGSRGRDLSFPADQTYSLRNAPSGVVRFDSRAARLWVDQISVEDGKDPSLTVTGRWYGSEATPKELVLQGSRVKVPAAELETDDAHFRAVFGLRHRDRWADSARPLRSDSYQLVVPGRPAARPSEALLERLPEALTIETHQVRIEVDGEARFLLNLSAPRALSETGAYPQRLLQDMHRDAPVDPEDAVIFNSFDGASAYDQPRAIHDELAQRRPDLTRYWVVADGSLEIPPGSVPLLIRTREWWTLLSSARFLVTNCWLPGRFVRRSHQTVQQAWHGTPYKAMGLDRIRALERSGYAAKMLGEVGMWSQFIAQNRYSADVFRSAYRFSGQMLEIGYPRNDPLTRVLEPVELAERRARLGLDPDQLVILYLPTWREDRKTVYRGLDLTELLTGLGTDARLLLRGHVNTIKHDASIEQPGVVDVTIYPDLNDLFAVSDVLITDYSSVMFDYSVTGKPIIFFAPDLDHYATQMRGAYFSLADTAPGPVVATTGEVFEAIRNLAEVERGYAARYRAWREKFNHLDDGKAAERSVDALLGEASPSATPPSAEFIPSPRS
jgi:CDP-glycerol glycerophosphotransferase